MRSTQITKRIALLLTALALSAGRTRAQAPATPDELFSPTRLHTLHVRLTPDAWAMMQPNAGVGRKKHPAAASGTRHTDKPTYVEGDPLPANPAGIRFAYARGQVEFDGQSLPDVGVRLKGNISYIVSAHSPRRPMKLDFDRFESKRHFAGITTLNLNNSAFDPSHAREALAFSLFSDMGIPAPRTGHAAVYLTIPGKYDHEYLGLYTLIEEVDKRFLKRHVGDADGADDGPLLKPERMRGLAYFGDDWAKYPTTYNPKDDVPPPWARRVIELARLVNRADDPTFRERIGLYLDVDEILRYVAVNSVIVNLDSFLSTGHNYYLYFDPRDGRARFFPWDMNLAFGGYSWVADADQSARTSITRAYVDHNRLVERLLAIDEYARAYHRHVRRLAQDLMSPARMADRRAAITRVLETSARLAREADKTGSPTTQPATGHRLVAPELWSFIPRRVAAVLAQLDGREQGFHPGFRDPRIVPAHMVGIAPAAVKLLAAIDADGDELLTESEVTAAIGRFLALAHAAPDGALDRDAAAKALGPLLPAEIRQKTPAQAWATWAIKFADTSGDAKLTAPELLAAYHRLLAGVDRDFDNQMCGREMVESLLSAGAPK